MFLCSVENHHKYIYNYFTMFSAKLLAKLCFRAPNGFSNVLPPNTCQCMQCNALPCDLMAKKLDWLEAELKNLIVGLVTYFILT